MSAAIPGGADPSLPVHESHSLARLRGARGEGLQVRVVAAGGRTLLRVGGALDAAAAPALEAALHPYRQGSHRLILDLRSLDYIETPGLRLLLALLEELPARGGGLCLVVQPHSRVERTLKLIGLDKRCPIVPTARQAWSGRPPGVTPLASDSARPEENAKTRNDEIAKPEEGVTGRLGSGRRGAPSPSEALSRFRPFAFSRSLRAAPECCGLTAEEGERHDPC